MSDRLGADRVGDLLAQLDSPRSLPAEVRAQLEHALAAAATDPEAEAKPLGNALSARMSSALADPIAVVMAELDGPRRVGPGLRARLAEVLPVYSSSSAVVSPPRWHQRPAPSRWVAAAASVVFVASLASLGLRDSARFSRPFAGGQVAVPTQGPGVTSGGTGAAGTGTGAGPGVTTIASSPDSGAPSPAAVSDAVTGGGGTGGGTAAGAAGPVGGGGISGVAPVGGPIAGGTHVRITGQGLASAVEVLFGSVRATSFRVVTDASVTAVSPAAVGPGSVVVTVVLADGTRYALSPGFSYIAAPTVTQVSPSSGSFNGGTLVHIRGRQLAGASSVSFGGSAGTHLVVVSATEVDVVAPAHMPGLVDITVATLGGRSAASSADRYLYLA